MNAQNLTQKSLEAIQTAQSMALENRNNYITPEHLLYALVDQDGGLIPSLLGKMGVDCNAVLAELDTAISALPVKYGPSAFNSEKNSYYFVKTITYDDYATLNGTTYEYTNEFPCKFKTRLGNGLNATTIKINDMKGEYFEEKTLSLTTL